MKRSIAGLAENGPTEAANSIVGLPARCAASMRPLHSNSEPGP